jgi:signal transduction histidine kinase
MAHNLDQLPSSIKTSHLVQRLRNLLIILLLVTALLINVLAPILAAQWVRLPFLGLLTEHTLVVASVYNPDWPVRQQLDQAIYFLRAVENTPVNDSKTLARALEGLTLGDTVSITLSRLDSPATETLDVEVFTFPWPDFLIIFGLPYLIGLVYLALGLFVYRVRASERVGELFLTFCALFSIFTGSFFNIYTFHQLTPLWTAVLPFLGAVMVHVALTFPLKARFIRKWPNLRFVPYLLAALLSINGVISLYNEDPTAYFTPWRLQFAFIGLSILAYFGLLVWNWYLNFSPLIKQQSLIILVGSLAAFTTALVWSIYSGWFGEPFVFNIRVYVLVLGPTILFPLSIAYAILRYQILTVDQVAKKFVVYLSLVLSIILAYLGIISILNIAFGSDVSLMNPVVMAVYGLVVVVFLEPARSSIEKLVDKFSPNSLKEQQVILEGYTGRLIAQELRVDSILALYLKQVQMGVHVTGLFVFFIDPRETVYTIRRTGFGQDGKPAVQISYMVSDELPAWLFAQHQMLRINAEGALVTRADIRLDEIARLTMMGVRVVVPLIGTDKLLGWLALADKQNARPYHKNDLAFLTNISDQTAIALENAQRFETANRKTQELMVLQETTLDIASEQKTDRILTSVLERATRLLDAMGGSIFLLNVINELLNNEICFNLDPDYASLSLKPGQGIAGRVAQNGQPINARQYSRFIDQVEIYPGEAFGSVLAVPLAWKGEVRGVLEVIRPQQMLPFDDNDERVLSVLANQAATALENARLLKEAHEQAEQLTSLNEVSRIISATLERDAALKLITEKAVSIIDAEAGSIFVVDEARKALIFEVATGPTGVQLVGAEIAYDRTSIAGTIAVSKEPMIVNDVAQDPHWNTKFDEASEFITRHILGVPMIAFNKVVGVIEVINKQDGRGFDAEDLETLNVFAGQAAIALINAERFTQTDQALATRVQELNTLQMIDRELNATLDLDTVLYLMLTRSMDALAASVGLVAVVDKEQTSLYFRSMIGLSREYQTYKEEPWPVEKGIIGRAVSQGAPVLAADGRLDNFASDGRSIAQLCIPVEIEGRIMCVMSLESTAPFTEQDMEFAARLASHASLAVKNARLFDEVKSANDAKTEFMSVASHELKIPMTSIKGYAKLLEMIGGQSFSDQQKEFLGIITANIDRMDRLVGDLLDVSRIEAGRITLELGQVSVNEVVEEVVQSVSHEIKAREQVLDVNIPPAIPTIIADYGRLVQVMTNLISNAYKYTPDGGQIAVNARCAQRNGSSQVIMISVSDTGFGISEEDQKELFNKFFRAADPNIRERPGTGLGLAITKSLIETHGGKMWFESSLGKGSTFGFDLPVSNEVHSQVN